jgi:hypothetical protein
MLTSIEGFYREVEVSCMKADKTALKLHWNSMSEGVTKRIIVQTGRRL